MPLWKQFSGNWTVTQAAQAKGAGTWPALPGAPTIGTATVTGAGSASVSFTPPANLGYPDTPITYTVTSNPEGITATGSSSPVAITGLTDGNTYTFTVTATNPSGTSSPSAASNSLEMVRVPSAPAIGSATAGSQQATVTFSPPSDTGYPSTILNYTVTSSPGSITGTGSSSPITVTGLTDGTAYTFTVTATNATGTSPSSSASNSVVPATPADLYAWGYGPQGELGISSSPETTNSPVQVGALTQWVQVSGGANHGAGVTDSGKLYAWGYNADGQLGQNNTLDTNSPVQVGALTNWKMVGLNDTSSTLAVKTDGTLWAWGNNSGGQLGLGNAGTVTRRSSPVQVGSLSNWASVEASANFSTAIKTDGTLWAWGSNTYGQLGQRNKVYTSSPVQVSSFTGWTAASVGENGHLVAIRLGRLYSIGNNGSGQLGLGDRLARSSPTQVGALTSWTTCTAGSNQSAAVSSGRLFTYGYNLYGQLGISVAGSTQPRSSPTQVGSLTTWDKVTMGTSHTLATKTNGQLWAIGGFNPFGQLGISSTVYKSSPVQVGAQSDWSFVKAGKNFTFGGRT